MMLMISTKDYWNEFDHKCNDTLTVDLWDTDKPAFGYNNTGICCLCLSLSL